MRERLYEFIKRSLFTILDKNMAGRPKSTARKLLHPHFSIVPGQKYYQCLACNKPMKGMVEVNFISNGKAHFKAKHPDLFRDLTSKLDKGQLKLSSVAQPVSSKEKSRQNLSFAFAQTLLPMNILRDPASRNFLNKFIEYGSIPDQRVLQNDITD